ncbi:sensor histidine kinase [Pseudomonas sp. LAIL14HWK12:I7]|uniref:sensor histidine kinase n=1 Tax=Pseudomonas sp. LAIL14HWK12:I7 TaxID=1259801 RepID=UPI00041A4D1F|nr:sensor histidine kinase [Pseudomonas sp. LAIL14HWK12:I7]
MRKIPFNVSARTARLIGRENVSSAEGAIIELVKNCYDADANYCIVYFDDRFTDLPVSVSPKEYKEFQERLHQLDISQLGNYFSYCSEQEEYIFSRDLYEQELTEGERLDLEYKLQKSAEIYIIDDGEGMTEEIIEKAWMTIGTDNKQQNFLSKNNRVKSGAKGIGRFALDRLGDKCRVISKTESADKALLWKVDWTDFDKQGLNIDGVTASLRPTRLSLQQSIDNFLVVDDNRKTNFDNPETGTHIKILGVRDYWRYGGIEKVYSELESLVPPSEVGGFDVFVFSRRYQGSFGQVLPNICDDFDYKLKASMDDSGLIKVSLTRQELDGGLLPKELLGREFFKAERFNKRYLLGSAFEYEKTIYELIPGLKDADASAHKTVGAFDFTLYFLKRTTNKKDIEIYRHKAVDSTSRKKWLDYNAGIRIYRDNFRVRPYGEMGKSSWDWLGLGRRQAEDPSSVRSGRWKVTPNNISGVVSISRISNFGLEDKSSREGIQENHAFSLFRSVMESLIKEFEQDRSNIFKEFWAYHQSIQAAPSDDDLSIKQEEDAEKLAQKIYENIKQEAASSMGESETLALALLKEKAKTREFDDRLEDMKKENSLLRVFASSGVTIAAFTHELESLNFKLGNRFEKLESLIKEFVLLNDFDRVNVKDHKSPYKRIEILRKDDERVKNWIKYSLRTIRKDKRKRVKINIKPYLETLRDEWNNTLDERQVKLTVDVPETSLSMRAYEIDLDCIFNNLIINSADAFKRTGFSGVRNINIHARSGAANVVFTYTDSGPGLHPDILEPKNIFKPTFTTKTNSLGEETGTGLGMWLLEKTLDEYNGKATLGMGPGFTLVMEM